MDHLLTKRDLATYSRKELHSLARYYGVNTTGDDLCWMLAIKIRDTLSGQTIKSANKTSFPTGHILPLELTNGEAFDGCQKLFIDWDAYDLILIENASQIAKEQYILLHLETILKSISDEIDGVLYLDSQTFEVNNNNKLDDQVTIDRYKKQNSVAIRNKKKTIITILALELGGVGHYAAYILSPDKTLYIYDSMSTADTIETTSVYVEPFEQLGKRIFDPKKIIVNSCINMQTYLQPTGGFDEHIDPPRLEKLLDRYNNRFISTSCTEHYFKLRQQIPEAQDHFCFMWSIWLILVNIYNIDINKIIQLHDLIPLVIIKRFIWAIVNYLQLSDSNQLYEHYFPMVWLQTDYAIDKRSISLNFAPYKIHMPYKRFTSIKECFDFSIDTMTLEKMPKTSVPRKVIDIMNAVTDECKGSKISCF